MEKKVTASLPGLHTMQNLNEYLRVLSEHGVNQVPHGRQRVHNRSACTIAARVADSPPPELCERPHRRLLHGGIPAHEARARQVQNRFLVLNRSVCV